MRIATLVIVLITCTTTTLTTFAAPTVRVVSLRPAVFAVENLVSRKDCEAIVALSEPSLATSGTLGGFSEEALKTRSSSSFFLPNRNSSHPAIQRLVQAMMDTIATVVGENKVFAVDRDYAEILQVTRYRVGDFYKGHSDFVPGQAHYDRVATFLVYLDDTEEGGETVFPYLSQQQQQGGSASTSSSSGGYVWNRETDFRKLKCKDMDMACLRSKVYPYEQEEFGYCCCRDLLRVKPRAGSAILFFPALPTGEKDQLAAHAACPVRKGEKHVVQQWFHAKPLPDDNAFFPKGSGGVSAFGKAKEGAKGRKKKRNRSGVVGDL